MRKPIDILKNECGRLMIARGQEEKDLKNAKWAVKTSEEKLLRIDSELAEIEKTINVLGDPDFKANANSKSAGCTDNGSDS